MFADGERDRDRERERVLQCIVHARGRGGLYASVCILYEYNTHSQFYVVG